MLLVPGHDELRAGRQGAFEDPVIRRVILDHGHGLRRLVYTSGDPPYLRHGSTGSLLLPTELVPEDATHFAQDERARMQLHNTPPRKQVREIRPAAGPVVRSHQDVGAEDDPGYPTPFCFGRQGSLPLLVIIVRKPPKRT